MKLKDKIIDILKQCYDQVNSAIRQFTQEKQKRNKEKTLEDKRENAPNQQNVERHDLIMKAIATTMRLGSRAQHYRSNKTMQQRITQTI